MDSREDSVALAEREGIGFDLLSDPDREVINAYGVADAGPEIAMPAVFIIRSDGVIVWRAVGDSMRDLPTLDAVLEAVAAARTEPPPQEAPAEPAPADVSTEPAPDAPAEPATEPATAE